MEGVIFAQLAVSSRPIIARGLSFTVSRPAPAAGPYEIGMSIWNLIRGIPDLYWLTCLGREYVRHFGREKLLSAPAASVERAGDGVCLQLTAEPSDMIEQPVLVESARTRVVRHLGADAFFDPARPGAAAVPAEIRKLLPEWAGKEDGDA